MRTRCIDWISGPTSFALKPEVKKYLQSLIHKWIGEWVGGYDRRGLSFSEIYTDPMKWGTSGGAPARHVMSTQEHEKIRSKWA